MPHLAPVFHRHAPRKFPVVNRSSMSSQGRCGCLSWGHRRQRWRVYEEALMRGMRRITAAFTVAAMLAAGLGTVTLEAAKPQPGGDAAICSYLKAVMDYEYVSPVI